MIKIILGFLGIWIYISFHYYGWKTSFELWQMKRQPNLDIASKTYISVEELLADIKTREKSWQKKVWRIIRFKTIDFLDFPRDTYRFFKRGIQRWSRGWADEDVWSIDWFLTSIIPAMLTRLKETKHGTPCEIFKDPDHYRDVAKVIKKSNLYPVSKREQQNFIENINFVMNEVAWEEVLDTLIWTFETARKIQEHSWIYTDEKNRAKNEELVKCRNTKHFHSDVKFHLMTREECRKYKKGWTYFQEYFFSLWD